jgi:hypothetical protein
MVDRSRVLEPAFWRTVAENRQRPDSVKAHSTIAGTDACLAEQAREPLGLTFIGRGFDVRVPAPFNRTIAEGMQKAAAECVEN